MTCLINILRIRHVLGRRCVVRYVLGLRCVIRHSVKRATELQLNKANTSDTETLFLDLNIHAFICNGFVSSKS